MNDAMEWAGFALITAFAYCIWPPAAIGVAGVVLVVKANARSMRGRPAKAPLLDRLVRALVALRGSTP